MGYRAASGIRSWTRLIRVSIATVRFRHGHCHFTTLGCAIGYEWFEREMRVRILNLVPHVTIRGFAAEKIGPSTGRFGAIESVTRQNRFTDIDALLVAQGNAHVTRLTIAETAHLSPTRSICDRSGFIRFPRACDRRSPAATLGLTVGDSVSALFSSGGYQNTLRPGTLQIVSLLASDTEIDHVFSMTGQGSVEIDESSQGSALA